VDDLRREDRQSGVDAETAVSKVKLEFEDVVELHIWLLEALSVDELDIDGVRECSAGRRK
jgi:hypothetical protein